DAEDEEFEYSDVSGAEDDGGGGDDNNDDGDDVAWEVVDAHSSAESTDDHYQGQNGPNGPEESNDSDEEFEDGDDNDGDEDYEPKEEEEQESESDAEQQQKPRTDLQQVDWEQVNRALQQEARRADDAQAARGKRRRALRLSKADKARELALHESHLLLLLATQLEWNALAQAPVLRALLLSLTAEHSGTFDFYTELSRQPLAYALEQLVRWFNRHFRVVATATTAAEGGRARALLTEARLTDVFFEREGRDYELAVLFTALCRSLRLYCRHTCVLDALRMRQTGAFEAAAAGASPGAGKRGAARERARKRPRTQSGDRAAAEAEAELEPAQSFWVWSEVYDAKTGTWVHVDAVRRLVAQPQEVEALRGKGAPLSYVVSVAPSAQLADVTPRYVGKWSKCLALRIANEWLADALLQLNNDARRQSLGSAAVAALGCHPFASSEAEEQALAEEQSALLATTEAEEMPTSVEAFRKHHVFCLERHLGRFECVHPRRAVGIFRGQPVFLRRHVQTTRSWYQWRRLGREVLESERQQPAKWYARGKQPSGAASGAEGSGGDSDSDDGLPTVSNNNSNNNTGDGRRPMFGEWQTREFVPPPVVDGVVPKNAYGNIEVWSAAHVPRGGAHVRLPRIEKVARELGLDFAPAVVGFEAQGDRNVPQVDGIVVAETALALLLDAHAHVQQGTIERAMEKNQAAVAKRWERLVKRLLLRQRLDDDYGAVASK
ncbi:hypothetical protein PybrP1_008656, partial [[Pythium] brassicae (nom. inval.)]